MTGTNHALTGAVIATVILNPIILIPVAFASHFVLDSLPHFGEVIGKRNTLSKTVWAIDGVVLVAILLFLVVTSNWLILLGAMMAISPDGAWIYRFVVSEKLGKLAPKPTNRFNSFHENIQKFESRKGLIVDIAWFIVFTTILTSRI